MMKAAPVAAFEVSQAKFLLQFFVVALDAPAQFGDGNEFAQRGYPYECGESPPPWICRRLYSKRWGRCVPRERWITWLPTLSWLMVDHQGMEREGAFLQCPLQEPVKQHSPCPRTPPVETERKLVEISLHVVYFDGALVGTEQPSFHQRRDPMHPGEQFVSLLSRPLHRKALLEVIRADGASVGTESIGEQQGAGFNMVQKKGPQSFSLSIGDELKPTPPETLGLILFHRHRNEHLADCSAPSFPSVNAAYQGLVHFDVAGKAVTTKVSHGATETVQDRPCGLIRSKAQKSMERLGRHTILLGSHIPGRSKPHSGRCLRAVKDGASRGGYSTSTGFAPPSSIAKAPSFPAQTMGARKARRPA